MFNFGILLIVALSTSVSAANNTSYFKEDHLTGATYIAIASNGAYTVTGREHMGITVLETGRWSKSGTRITFTPSKRDKLPYSAAEVTYRNRTFLSIDGDSAPTIAKPLAEIKGELDKNTKTLPPYVFFEVHPTVYRRETRQTYPFRTRPDLP